jgi:DNA polymerase I-like protein with 3'-5' exonuclease and polymerase domains
MKTLVIDFETFYSGEYTLKKHTLESYIRGDQFQPLVLSLCEYKEARRGVHSARGPEEIGKWISAIDWPNTCVVAQNAAFDVGILSLRYGVTPRFVIDTMSMERALSGPGKSASLGAMVERYGLTPKTVPYNKFIGKRFEDLDEALLEELAAGCEHDVALTREIAKRQLPRMPRTELAIIDMTVRMFTEPQLQGDHYELRQIALDEFERKQGLMDELGVTAAELQSAAIFTRLLEHEGEEVPYKPGKKGDIPCVAKTDPFMQELANRMDRAGLLAQARLDVRSTLDETRAARLAGSAERGLMPVALNYCGAATTRWSGADKVNWQNMPGSRQDPEMRLRRAIKAPEGHKLVVADFAQIEYRVLCALAGCEDKLEALRQKRDIYKEFAAGHFDKPETEVTKDERQFAKIIVLGCVYGMGESKFARVAGCDDERAGKAINSYRRAYSGVVRFWRQCDVWLELIAAKAADVKSPVRIKENRIILPNGLECPICVTWDEARRKFLRETRYGITPYWGGALTEFLCQSHARVILSDVMLRAKAALGVRPALLVHDELVYVTPEDKAESLLRDLLAMMSESPAWLDVPMAAEGWIGDCYGK